MVRLLILAIVAIGIFVQIPPMAMDWMRVNGYMDSETNASVSNVNGHSADGSLVNQTKREGRAILRPDTRGHFLTRAYINNKQIRVILDTGATNVVLAYKDARKLGFRPKKTDFTVPTRTANGRTYLAPVMLRSVRIGNAEERSIEAAVAPKGAMSVTLLGMSYLKKLKRVELKNGRLILEN